MFWINDLSVEIRSAGAFSVVTAAAPTMLKAFIAALDAFPIGYSTGTVGDQRWGMTIQRLANGRTVKLYAEALGERDHVSFNLFRPASGNVLLKPCEMPKQKVIDFVLDFRPD